MVGVLASSAIDCEFEPRLGQTKEYKSFFFASPLNILFENKNKTIRVTWYLYKMMFSHRNLTRLIMGGKVSGFKRVWSKVGTLTVYMLISCILMPKNCYRSGKSCKMYAIFTMCSSSELSLANANYAQTALYWFLLMLCKVSPCKYVDYVLLCFFFLTSFIHLRHICVFCSANAKMATRLIYICFLLVLILCVPFKDSYLCFSFVFSVSSA
jgi:hypothetical protein